MRISGDYHTHTIYSHGKGTVLDNALVAKEKGLSEIAITDHGFGKLFHGMKRRNLEKLKADIKAAEEQAGVRIYLGVEANIMSFDGDVDLKENDYNEFEIILCGVHRLVKTKGFKAFWHFKIVSILRKYFQKNFDRDDVNKKYVKAQTQMVINALRKNKINVLTHPNRYLRIDFVEVAKVCKEVGTAFELNQKSFTKKQGFTKEELKEIAETGVNFIINSDAHSPSSVGNVGAVLAFAEGVVPPEQVLNIDGKLLNLKNK